QQQSGGDLGWEHSLSPVRVLLACYQAASMATTTVTFLDQAGMQSQHAPPARSRCVLPSRLVVIIFQGLPMLMFYPEIKPYARHQIAVDAPHELYVDESGNPDGIPVLFVHGGPGAGCGKYDRRFFDPDVYRIILFDQRGCGRSTPHAELEGNNTQALVEDIEDRKS